MKYQGSFEFWDIEYLEVVQGRRPDINLKKCKP